MASGALSESFKIATSPVANVQSFTLHASTAWNEASTTLTLRPMVPKALSVSPNPVVGGTPTQGTVSLECPAGPDDIVVSLSSTMTLVAAIATPTVVVPKGARTATFDVTTFAVTTIAKPKIKGTANGVTKGKTLVVIPGS